MVFINCVNVTHSRGAGQLHDNSEEDSWAYLLVDDVLSIPCGAEDTLVGVATSDLRAQECKAAFNGFWLDFGVVR